MNTKKIIYIVLFIIIIFWVGLFLNKSKNNNQTSENQPQGSFETQIEYISKEDSFAIHMFVTPEITKTEIGTAGLLAINDYAFRKGDVVYGIHVAKLIDSKNNIKRIPGGVAQRIG